MREVRVNQLPIVGQEGVIYVVIGAIETRCIWNGTTFLPLATRALYTPQYPKQFKDTPFRKTAVVTV